METEDNIDNKYIIIKNKGQGGFGKVYLAKSKNTNKEVAVKLLKKERGNFNDIINLINIISSLNNQYIINMIDNGEGPLTRKGANKGKYQYVVYEYAPKGDLFDFLIFPNENALEEKYAKIIFKRILRGVQAMHSINICHRDIKLENILLDEKFNPKICDFGFVHSTLNNIPSRRGTRGYAAPEIFSSVNGYDGIKADIFSLGVTLLRLVTGKMEKSSEKIIEENKFGDYMNILNTQIKDTSPEFRSLIVKMVDFDPEKRPTINTILIDPWFAEVNDNDLNQQQDYIKEFEQREKNFKDSKKKDSMEIIETESIECHDFNKSSDDKDCEYFQNEYYMKLIDENKKNIKDHIKIKGNIRNKCKFMNSIANKIKKDNENYEIDASNNKFKLNLKLEYEIEDGQKIFEDKKQDMEDEYIVFGENGLNKKDLNIVVELLLTVNNEYLIRFYKKSGDLEDYYEKLDRIKSIIKSL